MKKGRKKKGNIQIDDEKIILSNEVENFDARIDVNSTEENALPSKNKKQKLETNKKAKKESDLRGLILFYEF